MDLIKFIYHGKERTVRIVKASPLGTLYLIHMLDEELEQAFGYCILSNWHGSFYPCNAKGREGDISQLLFELYKEMYKLKLIF